MSLELYAAYLLACVIFTLVPGPTVTLIVANSLTHGTRAGLLNVAGTQAGLAVFVGVLMVGLASVIESMGVWFDYVRFLGAAYLIWIGVKMFRSTRRAIMSRR
jgi:threonine/homoserine/homoserine lactone efflux protein